MSDYKLNHNFLLGATMTVALLGSLSTLLSSRRNRPWLNQAKELSYHAMSSDALNGKIILGGITGGLIGLTTALLLAPKPGSDLMKDIYRPFAKLLKSSRPASHKKAAVHSRLKNTAHRMEAKRKSPKKSLSSHKTAVKKSHHPKKAHPSHGKDHLEE